ncbi:hypothetical protein D3C87_2180820 [compost metagenome]
MKIVGRNCAEARISTLVVAFGPAGSVSLTISVSDSNDNALGISVQGASVWMASVTELTGADLFASTMR